MEQFKSVETKLLAADMDLTLATADSDALLLASYQPFQRKATKLNNSAKAPGVSKGK